MLLLFDRVIDLSGWLECSLFMLGLLQRGSAIKPITTVLLPQVIQDEKKKKNGL